MTVELLSIYATEGEEVAVTFAISNGEHIQKERFLLSATALADLRLTVGTATFATFDTVKAASDAYRVKKKALLLLSYGACSEKALCRKLVMKGFSRELAEAAAQELVSEGYINSSADALREAEKCADKLWGQKRIAATLFEKGYRDTDIKKALFALEDNGVDYFELCAERIRRTAFPLPTEREDLQRLTARLLRYGFSMTEIKEGMRRVKNEE